MALKRQKAIGKRLRDLRVEKGFNQSQIAQYLGMSQTGYSKYETGERDMPTYIWIKLARFYNTSTDYILGLTDEDLKQGIKEIVVKRLNDICNERGIALNMLAKISKITPSTVYSLMDLSRKDVSLKTIKKLCDGLDITLSEFFSTKEFDELSQKSGVFYET